MAHPTEIQSRLLEALRSLGGRATVGDLAQKAGLADHEVRADILAALSHVGGHVAVDAHGQMCYSITTSRPLPRFTPPWYARLAALLWSAFKVAFFAALSVALVMYFVAYVVLIIAVIIAGIAAAARGGDCDCDCDCKLPDCNCSGCDGCASCCDSTVCSGCNSSGDKVYEKTVARRSPELVTARRDLRARQAETKAARAQEKRLRSNQRRRRLRETLDRLRTKSSATLSFPLEDEVLTGKPPFFRAVRDFVFGPIRAPATEAAERDNLIGFIRDHGGRITATDAVFLTGLPRASADRLLLELAVRLGGDVAVSDEGAVVYTFDQFIVTAVAEAIELDWLKQQPDGRVTLEAFADAHGLSSADALSRLEQLRELADAEVEHGKTATFIFDAASRSRLVRANAAKHTMRDYRYSWERLEKAPAILGVPPEHRGWIWGFNTLNLVVSLVLLSIYADGTRVVGELFGFMSPELELWGLGLLPFTLSAAVFLIPLARLVVEAFLNRGRQRRNARRLLLLGFAHRLNESDEVDAGHLLDALALDASTRPEVDKALSQLAVEFEADSSLDFRDNPVESGFRFELARREIMTVATHADEYDPATSGLKAIVYDTSKPL
jgi:hypothetical protein